MDPNNAVGYGYIDFRGSSNIAIVQGKGRLGPAEVIDAEVIGALQGLRTGKRLPQAQTRSQSRSTKEIYLCLDNTAALTGITDTPLETSQQQCLDFKKLVADWSQTVQVTVKWSPGHTDILGNELADKLAKEGTSLPKLTGLQKPQLAFIRRKARDSQRELVITWWGEVAPEKYKRLRKKAAITSPELQLSRPTLHHLLAARTHHGDFAEYHSSTSRQSSPVHVVEVRPQTISSIVAEYHASKDLDWARHQVQPFKGSSGKTTKNTPNCSKQHLFFRTYANATSRHCSVFIYTITLLLSYFLPSHY